MRFLTGLGIGALIATTATLSPRSRRRVRRTCAARSPTPAFRWGACSCAARDYSPGIHRLARTVHDRSVADLDTAAVGVGEDARVGAVADRTRSDGQGPTVSERTVCRCQTRSGVGASRKGGCCRSIQPPIHRRDSRGGIDGRPRPIPHYYLKHVATGVDGTGGVQHQGLTRFSPRVEWGRNRRGPGRLRCADVFGPNRCGCVLPDWRDVRRTADIGPALRCAYSLSPLSDSAPPGRRS